MRTADVQVRRASRDECPVTLHLMVKNGESVVGRLLDCVGPYVRSVVAVLNDCEDATGDVLVESCRKHGLAHEVEVVTRERYPWLYFLDSPEVYEEGASFCGEVFPGPFTGELLLGNWSAARNVGWQRQSHRWKLHLDADDVVDDPEVIPGLCLALDEQGVEAAASRYLYHRTGRGDVRTDAYRERLCRNLPWLVWRDRVHEVLTGHDVSKVARVEGSLVVRDLCDSRGRGLRPPLRNLKVLYRRARETGWDLTARETAYLAAESRVAMPELSLAMAEKYLRLPEPWPEEAAWVCSVAGEVEESRKRFSVAAAWYERSLGYHPGVLAAYRLARAEFSQQHWTESLAAYERGRKNESAAQLLDGGGEVGQDAAKILAVVCLEKLGRLPEARTLCAEARARFPENENLAALERAIGKSG